MQNVRAGKFHVQISWARTLGMFGKLDVARQEPMLFAGARRFAFTWMVSRGGPPYASNTNTLRTKRDPSLRLASMKNFSKGPTSWMLVLAAPEGIVQAVPGRQPRRRSPAVADSSTNGQYGLGMLFATQPPRGIDNRIVSNCTTHFYVVWGRQRRSTRSTS